MASLCTLQSASVLLSSSVRPANVIRWSSGGTPSFPVTEVVSIEYCVKLAQLIGSTAPEAQGQYTGAARSTLPCCHSQDQAKNLQAKHMSQAI